MRLALAVLMMLHGIAHLVGMVVSWQLAPLEGAVYRTTLLSGHVDVGDAGMRVMGAFWLIAAISFGLASYGAFSSHSWWVSAAVAISLFSLFLSVLAWPDSRIGVVLNLLILAVLGLGVRAHWI
jgi:hypothetical protein